MKELIKLTKEFLQQEYSSGDYVLADMETCNYFRDHFKKQMSTQQPIPASKPVLKQPIAPMAPPVPKQPLPKPPPVAKVEKTPVKPVLTIDHSEFKKMLSDHFPNVTIIDPSQQ